MKELFKLNQIEFFETEINIRDLKVFCTNVTKYAQKKMFVLEKSFFCSLR